MEDKKYYSRTSKYHFKDKIDYLSTKFFLEEHKKYLLYNNKHSSYNLLLDNSLITYSKKKNYDVKIVSCGKYFMVYQFLSKKIITDKNLVKDTEVRVERESTKHDEFGLRKIELKNLNRTKTNLQRLIKANEEIFTTFCTLTFEENITDIKQANKILGKFFNNMKNRYFKDFSYICIPEFQKRGAIHYHFISNLDYEDFKLLSSEEKKIWDRRKKKWQIFRTLNYWKYGFSSVIKLDNINVVGYLTKYMSKDIDNRLFGFRKYTYSMNLIHPTITYLDLEDFKDFNFYYDILKKSENIYNSSYLTTNFYEYDISEEGCLYDVVYKEYKLIN